MARQTQHYTKASLVLPGGVNSSTRLNKAIQMPLYISKAKGSRVTDLNGNEYIDMCCAHGAGLLGHAHPAIDDALRKAMEMGYANSFETIFHEELASYVCQTVACADKVRFCSSGSEATLHMIRACRAYTGKNKIVRVEGHFHGYHEMIYIGGHPPKNEFPKNRTKPYIESEGIPLSMAELILPVPFNDQEALIQTIEKYADDIAILILEPVNFNCAGILADDQYLQLARKLTAENNIVLFFDEIQSAYKRSFQAVQNEIGIVPDVTTIGKSIGGGLPLSGFCGRKEIMDLYSPLGNVQHSGTFNANLVPVLSGLAFMQEASKPYFYKRLYELEQQLHKGLDSIIDKHDLNMVIPNFGARFNILLGRKTPARNYEETFCHNNEVFLKILRSCWERGVYFHDYGGGPAHHGFSIQHTNEDISAILDIMEDVFLEYRIEL